MTTNIYYVSITVTYLKRKAEIKKTIRIITSGDNEEEAEKIAIDRIEKRYSITVESASGFSIIRYMGKGRKNG